MKEILVAGLWERCTNVPDECFDHHFHRLFHMEQYGLNETSEAIAEAQRTEYIRCCHEEISTINFKCNRLTAQLAAVTDQKNNAELAYLRLLERSAKAFGLTKDEIGKINDQQEA